MSPGSPIIEIYSPWREPEAALVARHVGRDDELDAVTRAVGSFLGGGRPLPIYLFGPRGAGKSHILSLVRSRVERAARSAGATLLYVPEDIPEQRNAGALLARLTVPADRPRWTAWRERPEAALGDSALGRQARPTIILVEGLDRHLRALRGEGRRTFRHLLDARPWLYLVGTGVTLGPELTGKEEAFYGAFDPRPLGPLDPADAALLLDKVRGAGVDPRWPARRASLTALAGGNARALTALGQTCRELDGPSVAQALMRVVGEFTPHFQQRFRDLSPKGQGLVELLADAPRAVRSGEVAELLRESPASVSVLAGRMEVDGVLRRSGQGQATWFHLAEPLFRFWLEYRTAPPEQTRVGWVAKVLEVLLAPEEIAEVWWEEQDPEARMAAARAMTTSKAASDGAWARLWRASLDAIYAGDAKLAFELAHRAPELPPDAFEFSYLAWLWADYALVDCARAASRAAEALGLARVNAAVAMLPLDGHAGTPPRPGLRRVLAPGSGTTSNSEWRAAAAYVRLALQACEPRGAPWRLDRKEQRRLLAAPFLRAFFATRGKRPSHPALLSDQALEELLPSRQDGDLKELLVATAIRGHATAFAAVTRALMDSGGGSLPPCPVPAAPAPAARNHIARLSARPIGRDPVVAMSWAASWFDVSEEAFAQIEDRLRSTPPTYPTMAAAIALAALAIRNQERFERLSSALADSPLADDVDRVRQLLGQLAEREHGPLHPELEAIWRTVSPPERQAG